MGLLTARDTQVETRDLQPGGEFSLENVNGRVSVATWGEPRVRIEAERAAASEERLRETRIEVKADGARVEVRTRMPAGWLFGGGGAKVDYRITLPADTRVQVSTVNGRVEILGLRATCVPPPPTAVSRSLVRGAKWKPRR
jgi:hypothetical protein